MCYKQDADKSIRGFEKFVKPVLKTRFGTGKIFSTERHDSELATLLDQNAGIDGVIVDSDGWTYSFSSRVQFGKNFAAFSIRRTRKSGAITEWDKLNNPLQTKPSYHIHCFVDENEQAATVAIIETAELVKYVHEHLDQWRVTSDGEETFYYAPFDEVAAQIYRVVAGQVFEKKKAA